MFIRLTTIAVFVAATAVALFAPVPEELPAVALGQVAVYRIEIVLALVYGGLLLLTPLFQGVMHGRLPVELSHRGAKWQAQSDRELALADEKIARLEAERDMLLQSKHFRGEKR